MRQRHNAQIVATASLFVFRLLALWCRTLTRLVSAHSCRVVSCRVVSCRVVSCRVVSCRVVSCRVVSCRVVSCVVCRVSCVVCRVSCVVCRVSCVVCRVLSCPVHVTNTASRQSVARPDAMHCVVIGICWGLRLGVIYL